MKKEIPRRKRNQGIYMPATAAIALVVVTIVFALGYDTALQKRAAEVARSRLDLLCRNASKELPISGASITASVNNITLIQNSGVFGSSTLQSVDIATPLAPDAGGLTATSGPPVSLASPFIIPCPSGVTCRLYTSATEPSLATWIPSNFWSNADFGDTLACRMTVQVPTVLSGNRNVTVAVAWSLRQLGAALSPDPVPPTNFTLRRPTLLLGDPKHKEGGIIIGVDTALSSEGTTNEQIPNSPDFQTFSPAQLTSWGFAHPRNSPSGLLVTNAYPTANQQREERRQACLPLAAAVRNRVLVGVIGRLARGWGRDKVAMYVMNPLVRNPVNLGDGQYLANVITPPSLIVPYGQDITSRVYELPYVRLFKQASTATPSLPINTAEDDPSYDQRMRQLTGALRDCFHLYTAGTAGSLNPGISRVVDGRLVNFTRTLSGGSPVTTFMEGSLMRSISSDGALRLETIPATNPPWDQTPDTINLNPSLALEQVAAILGSTQFCPHDRRPPPGGGGPPDPSGNFRCYAPKPAIQTSPALVSNDLRGDIRGFLAAVNEQYIDPVSGSATPFGAYRATDIPRSAALPNQRPGTQAASLVLFLHNRIKTEEVVQIRTQVNRFEAIAPRRILVVYIPAQPEDLAASAIANLKAAFNISNSEFPGERENVLMVIAPTGGTSITSDDLRAYWLDSLRFKFNNSSQSAYAAFRFLFTEIGKL